MVKVLAVVMLLSVPVYFFGSSNWFWIIAAILGVVHATVVVRLARNRREDTVVEHTYIEERIQDTADPAPAVSEIQLQPAPQGASIDETRGVTSMRALGYIFTPLAAIAWYATVVICGLLYLVPETRSTPMPYFGGTMFKFFLDFAYYGLLALIVLNGLSGRWSPERLRKADLWSSRVGFYGTLAICILVLAAKIGLDGLSREAINLLLAVMAFAAYDYFANQGEDNRATSLRTASSAAALPQSPATVSALHPSSPAGSAEMQVHPGAPADGGQQVVVRRIITVMEPVYYARHPGELPPALNLTANNTRAVSPRPLAPPLAEPPVSDAASQAGEQPSS